jgi:Ca2+-binding EF-hand superfamily protein
MKTRKHEMDNSKIVGAILAISLTSVALYAAPGVTTHADGDKIVTKADAISAADARFAKMDANGDGQLNETDRTAMMKKHFAEMDADKNGAISEAEFITASQARATMRGDRHAKRMERTGPHDGHVGMGKGNSAPKGGGMKMLALADTDGDKSVTQAEFRKAAEVRFAKADSNNDGTISDAERKSMRKDRWSRQSPPDAQ